MLLSAATWEGEHHVLSDTAGLSTAACFDWLIRLDNDYQSILIGYSWQYDLNMQLRDVYRGDVSTLAMRDRCIYHGNDGDYVIQNMGGKITKLLRGFRNGKYFKVTQRCTVFDVFGFFQCSFVKALKTWEITAEDIGFIEQMKAARSTFSLADLDQMGAYNLRECELLILLTSKLVEAFDNVNITLESYHGAGAAGAAILRRYGVKRHIEAPSNELLGAVMSAYFGGRIQLCQQGRFTGPLYQLDINSAYPAAMRDLPSLKYGRWERAYSVDPARVGLYRLRWDVDKSEPVGPFPFRHKGQVLYPTAGEGWYWHHEVLAARAVNPNAIEVTEGAVFTPASNIKPYAFINDLYEARRRYKDEGKEEHLALKLGYNSMYGKNAQSLGGFRGPPPYQSFVWAGLTTSWCRATMYLLAQRDSSSVITIATDGLLSTRPLANTNEQTTLLGGLTVDEYDSAFVWGAGRYLLTQGESRVVKTRGFERADLDWDALQTAWSKDGIYAQVPVDMTRFIGYRAAVHLKRWDQWRTWAPMPKVLRAGQFARAMPADFFHYRPNGGQPIVRWEAYRFTDGEVSEPYKPKVQREDIEADIDMEQPL